MSTMLDFYQQHGISPVRQQVDPEAHARHRAALYRSLGIPPVAVSGKRVLEVGPGSCENVRYTASLQPDTYTLLEPNPRAYEALDATFAASLHLDVRCERVEDYRWQGRHDLVLCEGLLGLAGLEDRKPLLEALIGHVAIGGVLVLTCIDAISDHAEVLRRVQAQQLIDRSAPLMEQVAVLRPIFAPHLATLKGMTRSVDDWIIDNLLNPASIGPTFSIPDACAALNGRFELLGCSPRFLMDWRWYKESEPGLQWVIDSYWEQAHNLLDYRRATSSCWPRHQELMAHCENVRAELRAFEAGTGPCPAIQLYDIGWFGRGQQYLSFVRTA